MSLTDSTLLSIPPSRRGFLASLIAGSAGTLAAGLHSRVFAAPARRPRVLLRSSWQIVNIGDIAHTPGVIALLEKNLPDVEVRLWASGDLSAEVAAMLRKRFPELIIVKGSIKSADEASTPELAEAVRWCDFLLHGSGPSLVAQRDVEAFIKFTKKPFGVFGITRAPGAVDKDVLSSARFVFFRDSKSLEFARRDQVISPVLEFGPDGAFACDLRNESAADSFLNEHQLKPQEYVCCLSRLRFTPYWTIPQKKQAVDPKKQARNEAMKEHDHRALRETIIAIAKTTDKKIVLCPEDMTQIAVAKEMFWDKLPDDVRQRVVRRDTYWLTDQALSVYVRSAGVFGSEMHSPIMAIGNGVPAIVCRFEEQTTKGIMWKDIGLPDWLFDLDDDSVHDDLSPTVLRMIENPSESAAMVSRARAIVAARQQRMCDVLSSNLASLGR